MPTPPESVSDELTVRAVNFFLHTNYKMDEIMDMPELWLEKIRLLAGDEQDGD